MEVYLRYCYVTATDNWVSTDSGSNLPYLPPLEKPILEREREREITHQVKGKTNGFAESLCASRCHK